MRGRGWAVVACACVLLAAPALAAPAAAELRVEAPLTLTGEAGVAASEGVVALPTVRDLTGSAARLNITLLPPPPPPEDHRGGMRILPEGGAVGALLAKAQEPFGSEAPGVTYLDMEAPEAVVLMMEEQGARMLLAIGPADHGLLAFQGQQASLNPSGRQGLEGLPPEVVSATRQAWLAAEGPGVLQAQGTVRGVFEGVSFLVRNATTSVQVDLTSAAEGAPRTALLHWADADLRTRASEPFTLRAPSLEVHVTGTLRAQRAWGGVSVGADDAQAHGSPLTATGTMDGTLTPEGGAMRLRGEGDLAYLEVQGQRRDYTQVAAAGAGLALASALAYYGQHLRFVAAPLYARIGPEEVLDNDVRRRVLQHVRANPGADVKGSAAAVGVSWSTAAYHLQRLEREHMLLSRRAGRSKRFFVQGGPEAARAEAIGALRNPTALSIAKLVAQSPGVGQKDIGATLGIPPSTVSWHVRRLRDLGVLTEDRRWRGAAYAPGAVWAFVATTMA